MAELLPNDEAPQHEPEGINVRAVLMAAGMLAAATAGALLIVGEVGHRFQASQPAVEQPVAFADSTEATPSSSPQVGQELNELRRRERRWLAEYAWADRDERIARIPIERAMEIAAERRFQPIQLIHEREQGNNQRPEN